MKNKVYDIAMALAPELKDISDFIFENPELGHEEFKSCKAHVDLLKKHGFDVIEEYMDIKTAFRASYDSGKPGPRISFLSEYDALPGIGHGCAHNMLGATNTGAGIVLSKLVDEIGGSVIVFGTPAEETSGAKVTMADNNAFDDVDIAMEVHPGSENYKSGSSLAMEAIQFTFRGQTAHAAADPEKGINALDGVISTFVGINALRQHIKPTARVHGIIVDGGKAANIVPDYAVAQFYVRAKTKTYLNEIVEKVKNCARAGALSSGAQLEITNYELSYDNLVTNTTLSDLFTEKWLEVGVEDIKEPKSSTGSIDIGNVSQYVPAIHPYFKICDSTIPGHTIEFANATKTEQAYKSMIDTIVALVLTSIEIITDDKIFNAIKEEFNNTEK